MKWIPEAIEEEDIPEEEAVVLVEAEWEEDLIEEDFKEVIAEVLIVEEEEAASKEVVQEAIQGIILSWPKDVHRYLTDVRNTLLRTSY